MNDFYFHRRNEFRLNGRMNMTRVISRAIFLRWLCAAGVLFHAALVGAAEVRINLGTLAPRASTYYNALKTMGDKWKPLGVHLVIYPDGSQGGEAEMVRLMRLNSLQAGALTGVGLTDIEESVSGLLSIPMMYRNLEEFDGVASQIQPELEQKLLQKGFIVLFWSDAGWVRYFSKTPLLHPDDLKKMKTFVWAGNPAQVSIMKEGGFNPVSLETSQILPGLQTGLIDTVAVPPIFALAGQLDRRAPHMLELNWAPLIGALVMTKAAWDKIPADARAGIRQAAEEAGRIIKTDGRRESDRAVQAMKRRGLNVHAVTPDMEAEWRQAAEAVYPKIRGSLVPAEIFDRVVQTAKAYREKAEGKKNE
ncbi:MAG: TRAP transporter substrate-binding protein DctP [Verrucomicrobiota bacterium]